MKEEDNILKDKLNRDAMFYRIADINISLTENKFGVLKDMKKITNPDFQDSMGNSYLHMACQSHCIESIRILLELGANPNINNIMGFSPILNAVGSINENNAEILELMLQYELNLDKNEGDKTLKEILEQFKNDELNKIIKKYYNN